MRSDDIPGRSCIQWLKPYQQGRCCAVALGVMGFFVVEWFCVKRLKPCYDQILGLEAPLFFRSSMVLCKVAESSVRTIGSDGKL
jgi:hypothetical protein